jgi:hypothetical protein
MLIHTLIIFFIILIFYQIFLAHISSNIINIEGMDTQTSQQYKPYDLNNPNNALILSQQNAGNIQVLKQQMDGIFNINNKVRDLSGNLTELQNQVSDLLVQQQQYVQSKLPETTPEISGIS